MIVRRGAWYSYGGENISQGRDNAIKYAEENPEFAKKLDQEVRQKLEMGAIASANSVGQVDADADDEDEYLEEEE